MSSGQRLIMQVRVVWFLGSKSEMWLLRATWKYSRSGLSVIFCLDFRGKRWVVAPSSSSSSETINFTGMQTMLVCSHIKWRKPMLLTKRWSVPFYLSFQVSHFVSVSEKAPQQQPNFADFSHFREEVSIKCDFLLWSVSVGVSKKKMGKLQTLSHNCELFPLPLLPPPSRPLRHKCIIKVMFVKYMGTNELKGYGGGVHETASGRIHQGFVSDSFSLSLFNLILFVLPLVFPDTFYVILCYT